MPSLVTRPSAILRWMRRNSRPLWVSTTCRPVLRTISIRAGLYTHKAQQEAKWVVSLGCGWHDRQEDGGAVVADLDVNGDEAHRGRDLASSDWLVKVSTSGRASSALLGRVPKALASMRTPPALSARLTRKDELKVVFGARLWCRAPRR